jgi:hypothetical protein
MNTISTIYTIGFFVIWALIEGDHPDEGLKYVTLLFIYSTTLAALPFSGSKTFVIIMLLILIYLFFLANLINPGTLYNSSFAWLSLAYIPFSYIAGISTIFGSVKWFINN